MRAGAWEAIRSAMADAGADALIVNDPPSVRYLSGFTAPEDGTVIVLEDSAILITDGRYTAQADEEARIDVRIARPWFSEAAAVVGERRVAVEADVLVVADLRSLENELGQPLLETSGIVRKVRAVKSEEEIAVLREAARLTDQAFDAALEAARPGVPETDVARRIEAFLRDHGVSPSFDIVVASGARSAMPHGRASGKPLREGDLITLDLGARLHGYHADMTRTVALGEPTDEAAALHEAVLVAQELALAGIRAGVSGKQADQVARDALAERGLAEAFVHSLGHGVGLEIHEGPTLSQRSGDLLTPGMVVTVEPGAYFPGKHGVRIEDLVVVTVDGCDVLSSSPKELIRLPVR